MLQTATSNAQIASYYIASNSMLFIVPWVVRWAMCLRLASFYPPSLAGRRKRWAVVVFPICMQLMCLVAFSMVLQEGYDAVASRGIQNARLDDYRLMLDLISYSSVVACNLYFNFVLLQKFITMGGRRSSFGAPSLVSHRESRPWFRIKQLFRAITFAYVLPTCYDIALIVVFCTVQGRVLGFMLVINVYTHVFAGTLACLSSAAKWREKETHFYPSAAEGAKALSDIVVSSTAVDPLHVGGGTAVYSNSRSRVRNFNPAGRDSLLSPGLDSVDAQHQQMLQHSLHRTSTVGGHALIAMPQSVPLSESKLLLHQRRRVSLAVPERDDQGHVLPQPWQRSYSADRSDAIPWQQAHISLPPSTLPSEKREHKGSSSSSSSAGFESAHSSGDLEKGAAMAVDAKKYTTKDIIHSASQKLVTSEMDLSPRSLEPKAHADDLPQVELSRMRTASSAAAEAASSRTGGATTFAPELSGASTGPPPRRRQHSGSGPYVPRTAAQQMIRHPASSATITAPRGSSQEVLSDDYIGGHPVEHTASASGSGGSGAEDDGTRRSSEATLLNPSSSIGTPTSGIQWPIR